MNENGMDADSFRQLTIWDVIQQCEHPTYSVKSLFAGCGEKRSVIRQITDSIGVGFAEFLVRDVIRHYFEDCYRSAFA